MAFSGLGTGIIGNPYQITTTGQLEEIKNEVSANYVLMNDLDLSSITNWYSIIAFSGTFDGNGFKIFNLTKQISTTEGGLFYKPVAPATIKNIGLENVNMNGGLYFGALIGWNTGAIVSNCYVTGQVVSNTTQVGGIIGFNQTGNISNSYNMASVTGVGTTRIGGVVGRGGNITNCFNTGIIANTLGTYNDGGINDESTVVTNSFWDTQTSGVTVSGGGTGLTTTQMKQQSSYTNWDFDTIWEISDGYPYLKIFQSGEPVILDVSISSAILQSGISFDFPFILVKPSIFTQKYDGFIRVGW